jgi:hypothetical protein
MKKVLILLLALAVMLPFLAYAQDQGYYDRSYVRLSYVKGDVYIQRGQDLGYEQAEVNLVVVEGDKIGAKDGRAEIQLGLRNYLRLDRDTQVDVAELPRQDNGPTKLHLLAGSVFLRVNSLDRERNFEIHTPDASFYILKEGLYRVDVRENRETEFSVYSGEAEAAGEEGSVLVQSGEHVIASDGHFVSQPSSFFSDRDDFSDWNEGRDALYARRVTRTYLPADYYDYEYELNDYGRWVNEPYYGYVWVPRVPYDTWRPYYYGRWAWYPIIGWTWISYEPWGWCTFHYGRWGWRLGLGWYWIPRGNWFWGPAWVHWYHSYDYVGWVPLSYYNYPAVLVNNVFYDRYTYRDFPNNSRTLTVVHKDQLQSRRISDLALNEAGVSRLGKISLQSSQPSVRPAVDRAGDVALKARTVLSRDNVRSVGRSFSASGKRLSSADFRSSALDKNGGAGDASGRRVIRDQARAGDSLPLATPGRQAGISRNPVGRENANSQAAPESRTTVNRNSIETGSDKGTGSTGFRTFPSRQPLESSSVRSSAKNGVSAGSPIGRVAVPQSDQGSRAKSGSIREMSSRDSIREFPSRNTEGRESLSSPRTGRSNTQEQNTGSRVIRKNESGSSSATSSSGRSLQGRETNPIRDFSPRLSSQASSRSKSYETPSRSYSRTNTSSPSRTTSPLRSFSAPSRTLQSPSRSFSAPSRSYSLPSRSSTPARSLGRSSPSRSLATPSRSFASPPSRSSGAPSRSLASPSGSSSAPSRSSSRPSRSSGSSTGRVRKK